MAQRYPQMHFEAVFDGSDLSNRFKCGSGSCDTPQVILRHVTSAVSHIAASQICGFKKNLKLIFGFGG